MNRGKTFISQENSPQTFNMKLSENKADVQVHFAFNISVASTEILAEETVCKVVVDMRMFCILVLMWSQCNSATEILNIMSFLKSFCYEFGSSNVLILTSQWARLYDDFKWWQFTKLMLKANISIQVSELEKWCSIISIPEGHNHLIILIFEGKAIDEHLLQKCSEMEQISSKHNWLLLTSLQNVKPALEIIDRINLRFDSNFMVANVDKNRNVELLDVYKTGKSAQKIVSQFGNWTANSSMLYGFPRKCRYIQRQNMHGYQLQAVTVLVNNFYTQIQRKNNTYVVTGGYFGNAFLILQELLNFSYSLQYLDGYSYGSVDKDDQNWTGIIGILQRREADISVSEVSVVSDRLDAIGFSFPIHYVARRIYAHLGAKVSMFHYYWQPYSPRAWAALLLFLLGTILLRKGMQYLMCMFGNYSNYFNCQPDIFIHISISLQQGTDDPYSIPLRILQWTTAFAFLIINIAYGAKLTSTSTVNQDEMPLASLQDVLDNSWKFSIVKGSLSERNFQEATINSVEWKIWKTQLSTQKHRLVEKSVEGFQQVLVNSDFVFMGQEDSSQQALAENFTPDEACQIGVLPDKYFRSPLSFGLQKNSEYKSLIDFHLLRLSEVGIDKRLSRKWIPQPHECLQRTHDAAELFDVLPIFTFLLSGVILSFLLLFLEMGIEKRIGKRSSRKFMWNKPERFVRRSLYPKQIMSKKKFTAYWD